YRAALLVQPNNEVALPVTAGHIHETSRFDQTSHRTHPLISPRQPFEVFQVVAEQADTGLPIEVTHEHPESASRLADHVVDVSDIALGKRECRFETPAPIV